MENSDLINIAVKARALAYAPYSKFAVGAAGCHEVDETSSTVHAEFNPTMKVFAATLGGNVQEFDLAEPLPLPGQGVLEGTSRV
jgi:hypothetical protein